MCSCVFFDCCLSKFSSKLSVANVDSNDSDDDPLALALSYLCFPSASQIHFASYRAALRVIVKVNIKLQLNRMHMIYMYHSYNVKKIIFVHGLEARDTLGFS